MSYLNEDPCNEQPQGESPDGEAGQRLVDLGGVDAQQRVVRHRRGDVEMEYLAQVAGGGVGLVDDAVGSER